jgi:hypothetical protein
MTPKLRLDDGTWLTWLADSGRTLLVDLAGIDQLSALAEPYADRLDLVRASSDGAGLSALPVRPEGLPAWPSGDRESDSAGLQSALTRWLGVATSTVPG